MMEAEIRSAANQLAAAVTLTMDPIVSQEERHLAYKACEEFKEKSPLCVQCGLFLAENPEYSTVVRHFGLQLMEHCVKYKWYNLTQEEKIFIKEKAMRLVEEGAGVEPLPMRDALSRVVVEMIKREWPQHWGSLLSELDLAASRGTIQTELVLLVLLRLVEDVAILQTLESVQRRKDLHQALTLNMADLFSFFIGLIDKHLTQCNVLREMGQVQEAAAHARVVQVVLLTLCGFVEWVQMVHILANDGRLLKVLCLLLNNPDFQDGAAECLLHILSRKGRTDERKPLLMLFSEDIMSVIFQAANTSATTNYQFLKKLTRVLTGLGTQLTSLWTKKTDERPSSFQVYLEAINSFAKHPSLTLVHYANSVFNSFMKHEFISQDPLFKAHIPKWIEATGPKIIKIVYPSSKNNFAADTPEAYAAIDYDSEAEFNGFFHRYRVDLLEGFRLAGGVAPRETYDYVVGWLRAQCQREVVTPTSPADVNPRSVLEWEALTQALSAVIGKIVVPGGDFDIQNGLSLIDMCLALEPPDPRIFSTLLSCISSLFAFLAVAPPHVNDVYLPRMLDKIFSTIVFSLAGETKTQRSREVKNLHRHAASLMVKIAQKYPSLLLPFFSRIHSTVTDLQAKREALSSMEAVTLQEALLLITNHMNDYERQTAFVAEMVSQITGPWMAMTQGPFASVESFMSYVGLDQPPREPSVDDIHGRNRSQIHLCLEVIYGVVKRCAWPSDPDAATRGGFIGPGGVLRSPAAPHIIPLLPGLLAISHCTNALTTPQALALLHPGYKGAYAMVEVERQNLLGAAGERSTPAEDPAPMTPLRRMQQFVSSIAECVHHSLALFFSSIGHDAYTVPGLPINLVASVFSNLDVVPDFRCRFLVRVFLKAFISSCPPASFDTVLIPVLSHFVPFMYHKLYARWQQLTEMRENGTLDENNTDTQEVLEDVLNRTLTKEYLDVLKVALYGSSGGSAGGDSAEDAIMMDDSSGGGGGGPKAPSPSDPLSDLGVKLMQCDPTCTFITLLLLKGLSWCDSVVSLKCNNLVGGVVLHLISVGRVGPELAGHILASVLHGLQVHGQHDSNQGALLLLGTLLYSILRPLTDNLCSVMQQIPNVNLADLQKLDEKMLKEVQKGVKVDKVKKEMFRKVTNPLIGCNVGQLFKKKVSIRDLPRLEVAKPSRSPTDTLSQEHLGASLATLFDS